MTFNIFNNMFFVFTFIYVLSLLLYYLNSNLKLNKNNNKNAKLKDVYEYGSYTIGSNFSINNTNFFILAILFILFDIELIFIYPWFLGMIQNFSIIWLISMLIFSFFIIIGVLFEIKNSILNFYKNK